MGPPSSRHDHAMFMQLERNTMPRDGTRPGPGAFFLGMALIAHAIPGEPPMHPTPNDHAGKRDSAARRRPVDLRLRAVVAASLVLAVINLVHAANFRFNHVLGNTQSLDDVREYPTRLPGILLWASLGVAVLLFASAAFAGLKVRRWIITVALLVTALVLQIQAIGIARGSYRQDATFTIRTWDCPATIDAWSLGVADERCTPRAIGDTPWRVLPEARLPGGRDDGMAPDVQHDNIAVWNGFPRGGYTFTLALQGERAPYGSIMVRFGDPGPGDDLTRMYHTETAPAPYWYTAITVDSERRTADIYVIADPSGAASHDPWHQSTAARSMTYSSPVFPGCSSTT
jgi:hypothetical protein